jgi:hypothetical protein
MKITEYGAIRSAADIKRKRAASATGDTSFADLLNSAESASDTAEAPEASDVAATAALNNMLALQEISEEDVQRKKMVARGKNMLDTLDKLRQQLLIGAVPPHTLQELSRQLSIQRQSVSDPRLLAIIDDIELRAAVELAKLQMAAIKPEN